MAWLKVYITLVLYVSSPFRGNFCFRSRCVNCLSRNSTFRFSPPLTERLAGSFSLGDSMNTPSSRQKICFDEFKQTDQLGPFSNKVSPKLLQQPKTRSRFIHRIPWPFDWTTSSLDKCPLEAKSVRREKKVKCH